MGWLLNEGPRWFFMGLWLLTNIGLFIGYFLKYYNGVEFYYFNTLTGLGLAFARASAAPLNFNCMLILLPVCRNLISFLRGSLTCCKRNVRRQLDKNITFHKWVAYMICVMTAIHYYAHVFNFERLVGAWNPPPNSTNAQLKIILSQLPKTDNGSWVNPIRSPNSEPIREVMTSVPGITGVVITLALVLMVSSSTEVIRRSYFEVFWFTHHLFIIFFIGLVLHGIGGVVRGQINVAEHDPTVCSKRPLDWGKVSNCAQPQFAPGGAQTWKWVLAPVVLYLIERAIRFWRSQQRVVISKVVKHPSKVIQLQMQKKGFKMEAGQYVFLHCPSISRLEWHPFTLTSAPDDDHFSVHIRLVGDWTNALAEACHVDEGEFQENWKMPSVAVDGPFGTCSEDIYRYQVGVLVGAGIGVTPFASILKDIWYRSQNASYEMKLQKVYFYWICPDTNAFEWFSDLLKYLEEQMAAHGNRGFLEYNIYLTRGWGVDQAKNIILREEDYEDVITGLKQKTYYGRPNWNAEFTSLAKKHPETSVGVFFCGPKPLSRTLHKLCNQHSRSENGVRFFYNKENF